MSIDWSRCPDVESVPAKVSGAWVVKGTRVPADAIIANAREGYSAREIARDIFPSIPVESIRRVIDFARQHDAHPA